MEQSRPTLVSSENVKHTPLLIIDKKGRRGAGLARMLEGQFLQVVVSGQDPQVQTNCIHIPFHKKIPVIPDNYYSYMFVFYQGEEEILDMLPALMKKANDSKSKLLFITSLPYSSPELFKQLGNHIYLSMKVLVYGETFSPREREHNVVSLFLHQAKRFGKIEIPNDGVGKLYPILLDDVYAAIVTVAFGAEKKQRVFYAFPKHPISELSAARMLQKQNPLLHLDFRKYTGNPPKYYIPQDAEYLYPEYPLEEKMNSALVQYEEPQATIRKQTRRKYVFPKVKKRVSHTFFWLTLLCVLVTPILLTAFISVSGIAALQLSVREIEKGNISLAKSDAKFAETSLHGAGVIGSSLFYLDPVLKLQKEAIINQIRIGEDLAETEVDMLQSIEDIQSVVQGKSVHPKEDFQKAMATLKNSLISVQKMRAEGLLPRRVSEKVESLEPVLVPLENTIDAFPSLVGFEGKRVYLVLFQNNMELRPGGGFIGSYGLLEMDQGKIRNFTVHDVYDADGRLTVHVEPPYGLRRYLGASHWFLRDSNFAVDFPQNAKQAKTFLQLETGQNVDGVIAVDTSFLQNLLKATGPVTVPDYNEVVTNENVYLRTETHAEKDFFPGSTQKKDFLQSLLTAMQEKVSHKDKVNFQLLISQIGESMQQKHVLFVFSDPATQQLFTVNSLSSSLWDSRSNAQNTYLDFLGVIDANVGINKVNYYLKRSIDQKSAWDESGTIQTTSTVTYLNTSKKTSQFGGDYKNYVRFVLPPNVQLQEITIDGVKQLTTDAIVDPALFTAKGFSPPKGLEIEKSQEEGKQLVGFLLFIPAGSTKKVAITYSILNVMDMHASALAYNLHLFKQPGTLDDAYSFTFSYPRAYQIVTSDKALSDVGGKLLYSGVLDADKELKVAFSKR